MTNRQFGTRPGRPHPLGATPDAEGTNFALFSQHATPSSCSSSSATTRRSRSRRSTSTRAMNRTFYFWHIYVTAWIPGWAMPTGSTARSDLHGAGHRFNPNKVLIDPYGRGTTSTLWDRVAACGPDDNVDQLAAQRRHRHEGLRLGRRHSRSAGRCRRRSSTRCTSAGSPSRRHRARSNPGTYLGRHREDPLPPEAGRHGGRAAARLRVRRGRDQRDEPAHRAAAHQLLGLQPDQLLQPRTRATASRPTRARTSASSGTWSRRSTRPASRSSSTSSSTTPARATTRARRSASGASTTTSTTTSSRDKQYYTNLSGCGNTFNCNVPLVEKFIAECLLFWVREMHVDGFRFDLASILSRGPGRPPDGQPAGPLAHRARRRAGRDQDHRRGLGRRRPLPGRLLPGLPLGRVERPLPRRRPPLRQGRQGAGLRDRGADRRQRRHLPGRRRAARSTASTSSPPTTASRSTTSSRTTASTTRRTARATATAPTTTSAGTAASRATPTTPRSRRCGLARSATS